MNNVKIRTLTPIHIGSGNILQYGNDFVKGIDKEGYEALGIIDPSKVLQIIGEDNLNKWVSSIDRGDSTDEIIRGFGKKVGITSYSSRIIELYADNVRKTETLRELIHDGMGRMYLPGSSIKGAIRTAILASIIPTDNDELRQLSSMVEETRGNRTHVKANKVEGRYFGDTPNTDCFRFLRVSDAIFDEACDIALRMVNINERQTQSFWDCSKPQLIEAISAQESTSCRISIDYKGHQNAGRNVHDLPTCMTSLEAMFKTINEHTRSLIESEIEYWNDFTDEDSNKVEEYVQKMKKILQQVKGCSQSDGKQCVLRVGHGSGWRFITGAWSERLDNFDDKIVPASRPSNYRYTDYDFPKSRRVSDDTDDMNIQLLGFIKLTIS